MKTHPTLCGVVSHLSKQSVGQKHLFTSYLLLCQGNMNIEKSDLKELQVWTKEMRLTQNLVREAGYADRNSGESSMILKSSDVVFNMTCRTETPSILALGSKDTR